MNVPFNDLKRGFYLHQNEYEEKALEVLRSGWYILGHELDQFEDEFKNLIGTQYSLGVDNGLNAIVLGIRALGIGAGDEVIVQANTYIATVMGVTMNGATPILVEPNIFYNIDTEKIEERITPKTKAILVTHLYGQASKMDDILRICKKYDLFLLEDCAQSHLADFQGIKTGNFGDLGFFSFYPTKNMGGFGDGGAIATNNEELYQKIKILRNYGSNKKYHNEVVGYNSRLDELQAGLLQVKVKYIQELTKERRDIAAEYLKYINNSAILLPQIEEHASHVWHLFVIRTKDRNKLRKHLEDCGVATDVHYPIPPHLSRAYINLGYKEGDFPITETYANQVVSLPIFNGMTNIEIKTVINAVNTYTE